MRFASGSDVQARYAKPDDDRTAVVGKMCEPREKSQRVRGREREAGCDFRMGTSKRERVDMPPALRRAVETLRAWRAVVEDIVE